MFPVKNVRCLLIFFDAGLHELGTVSSSTRCLLSVACHYHYSIKYFVIPHLIDSIVAGFYDDEHPEHVHRAPEELQHQEVDPVC